MQQKNGETIVKDKKMKIINKTKTKKKLSKRSTIQKFPLG